MSRPHGFVPRHCWAIPPNRCSASRGGGGYWDSEKDLLEGFSSDCSASEVCPGAGVPSHQKLQQETLSNSCFPNTSLNAPDEYAILRCHQSIVLPKWNCQAQRTCPQGVSWSFGFSDRGNAGFWDLQRVLSAFRERSQVIAYNEITYIYKTLRIQRHTTHGLVQAFSHQQRKGWTVLFPCLSLLKQTTS